MVSSRRGTRRGDKKSSLFQPFLLKIVLAFILAFMVVFSMMIETPTDYGIYPSVDYTVDESCTELPTIRQSGTYFLDGKIQPGTSPEGLTPSFNVGSYYANKVTYHMKGDLVNFNLIKEALKGREGQVGIDFGANQGFYTYYLAALGMQVHSFEINENNFKSLQHGAEFNPKDIADRVHLYPVGIGAKNGRFGMENQMYEGFFTENAGPILGATFDCFAHHMKSRLDLSKGVAFVKLDVEGFEIAVLQGAKHSLFREGSSIGAMLMEVGPNRWQRAKVDITTGVENMKELASHFKNSYLLVRGPGTAYAKTCPLKLGQDLNDKTPKDLGQEQLYKVGMAEWKALLTKMKEENYDCNFFYQN